MNVIADFKKCGIVPLNRQKVLVMLPSAKSNNSTGTSIPEERQQSAQALDSSLLELLKTFRQGNGTKQRMKRTKVSVTPGKSVGEEDLIEAQSDVPASVAGPSTSGLVKPRRKRRLHLILRKSLPP